eukprot:1968089-Prymnesium_polylepis.2
MVTSRSSRSVSITARYLSTVTSTVEARISSWGRCTTRKPLGRDRALTPSDRSVAWHSSSVSAA